MIYSGSEFFYFLIADPDPDPKRVKGWQVIIMLVIASHLAKTTKLCLKKRLSAINVVKKVFFFVFLKFVFTLVGSGMIIPDPVPDPDPRKTFRIRPDPDPDPQPCFKLTPPKTHGKQTFRSDKL